MLRKAPHLASSSAAAILKLFIIIPLGLGLQVKSCGTMAHVPVYLLSSVASSLAYSVCNAPWAQNFGGVHGSSLRLWILLGRYILKNLFPTHKTFPQREKRGKNLFYSVRIQPNCDVNHRQCTKDTAKTETNLTLSRSQVRDNSSLVAQSVQNLPAMQQTPLRFLGQEDPLEKE